MGGRDVVVPGDKAVEELIGPCVRITGRAMGILRTLQSLEYGSEHRRD